MPPRFIAWPNEALPASIALFWDCQEKLRTGTRERRLQITHDHATARQGNIRGRAALQIDRPHCDGARAGTLLWSAEHSTHLVQTGHSRSQYLALAGGAASLCRLFTAKDRRRLHVQPYVRGGLWIHRRVQQEGRANNDPRARYPSIDPGAELFARRDAGDGSPVPAPAAWARAGFDPSHLHWPGLEYRVQFLLFAQEHSP